MMNVIGSSQIWSWTRISASAFLLAAVFVATLSIGSTLSGNACAAEVFVAQADDSVTEVARNIHNKEMPETSVGMSGRIEDLRLPGPRLVAKEVKDMDPVVVRIADVQPHGELFRYTIEYWGMEPGVFDLKDYLLRPDGTVAADLPSIPIHVISVTVVENGRLNEMEQTKLPWVGGYRLMVALGAIGWVAVSIAILTMWRKPRNQNAMAAAEVEPVSWAQKLRPMLKQAKEGTLAVSQQAELERLLVAYWRDKLTLNDCEAKEALEKIKEDSEARVLLDQLELWLHRPGRQQDVDVDQLLKPYDEAFNY